MGEPMRVEISATAAQLRNLGTARVRSFWVPQTFMPGDKAWILGDDKRYSGTIIDAYGLTGAFVQVGIGWVSTRSYDHHDSITDEAYAQIRPRSSPHTPDLQDQT